MINCLFQFSKVLYRVHDKTLNTWPVELKVFVKISSVKTPQNRVALLDMPKECMLNVTMEKKIYYVAIK